MAAVQAWQRVNKHLLMSVGPIFQPVINYKGLYNLYFNQVASLSSMSLFASDLSFRKNKHSQTKQEDKYIQHN